MMNEEKLVKLLLNGKKNVTVNWIVFASNYDGDKKYVLLLNFDLEL